MTAPAAKSSEAKINDAAEPAEMPDEEINEKAAEEKPEPQDRAVRKKQRTRQVCLLLMPRQEMKG